MTPDPCTTRRRLLPALLALSAAACGPGAEPSGSPGPERVLLVVTDATHAAHLSCYGGPAGLTPSIDALAADGVRFSRAFSNNTWTLASTASLMTGELQEVHGAVTNHHVLAEDATTAAELFHAAGWSTAAFVQMAYASAEFGFGQGFDSYRYYAKGQSGRAGQTVPDVLEWLNEHGAEHWFVYLHLRRPHSPYKPNPTLLARQDEGCALADGARDEEFEFADSFGARELSDEERAHVEHLYRANLATSDALLDEVLASARALGALIVETSDHGEALGQHGVYGHGGELWAEGIDIPLVFWWPGVEPRVDDGPACTIDVLPTLVELCGLPVHQATHWNGRSLVDRLKGATDAPREPVFASARHNPGRFPKVAVVEGDWKLIYDPEGPARLYNRREDPADTRDRSAEEVERTARLTNLAAGWHRRWADVASSGTFHEGLDPALTEDLRALGYGD